MLIHVLKRVTIKDYDGGSGIRADHERTDMGESSGTSFVAGLEDVVAAETRLSGVDGEAGRLTIAGFPVEELAGRASFEETLYLLWNGALPDREELSVLRKDLSVRRA